MSNPILGATPAGDPLSLDVERLIGSHACIVANAGGGKSGLIRRLLDPILSAYPESLSTDELAAASGYSADSGNFKNLRGSLKTPGIIEYPSSGKVRAADWLFP